jgi:hypothetical protein
LTVYGGGGRKKDNGGSAGGSLALIFFIALCVGIYKGAIWWWHWGGWEGTAIVLGMPLVMAILQANRSCVGLSGAGRCRHALSCLTAARCAVGRLGGALGSLASSITSSRTRRPGCCLIAFASSPDQTV